MKIETRVGTFILVAIGLFFYLSINIGEFRLDKRMYYSYKAYFEDTGGLDAKSPVKIAGVSVGWVETIKLMEGGKAEVKIRVERSHKLAKNAYAMIISEGLIGSKSVEIDPGDPNTGLLLPGSTLIMPGKSPASVNELLEQFRDIATHVQDIVSSVRSVVSTQRGEDQLKMALEGIAQASNRMAGFSQVLERTLKHNEDNLNMTMADLKSTMASLKTAIPQVSDDFHRVSGSVSQGADSLHTQLDAAGPKITKTFDHAGQIAEKINDGQGTIGKLVNEEELYKDLKKGVKGLKDFVGKGSNMSIYMDVHWEKLYRTSNSKGYFELKLRPSHDYFYTLQLVSDNNGSFRRTSKRAKHYDQNDKEIPFPVAANPDATSDQWYAWDGAARKDTTEQTLYDVLFGFQFGKRFNRMAFRMGLFENTFGAGVDFYVPLYTDAVHWITTFEAFDFNGINRYKDRRPHLKWLNKVYFMKHLYTCFGVDDVVSKYTSTPFFGGGLRFSDDDIKLLLGQLGSVVKK